jgi:hypothetical protein
VDDAQQSTNPFLHLQINFVHTAKQARLHTKQKSKKYQQWRQK